MKKYNIGEVISNIRITHTAYAVEGALKGAFISVDFTNENRLVTHYPDGYSTYDFRFLIKEDMPEEDTKQWVFLHELDSNDDEYVEILNGVRNSMIEALKNGIEITSNEEKDVK